jgi:hypothetical protein
MAETTAGIRHADRQGLSWFAALLPISIVNLLLATFLYGPFLADQSSEIARAIQSAEIELNAYLSGKPAGASHDLELFFALLPKLIMFACLLVLWIIACAFWLFHTAPRSAWRGTNLLVAIAVAMTPLTLLLSRYWTSWRPELEGNATAGFPTFTVAVLAISLLALAILLPLLSSQRHTHRGISAVFFRLFGVSVVVYAIMSLVFLYGGPSLALLMGTVNIVMLFLLLLFLVLCGVVCASYQGAGAWLIVGFIVYVGLVNSFGAYREVPQNVGRQASSKKFNGVNAAQPTSPNGSQLDQWLAARRAVQGNDNSPIFIVAASGGGLRAAMRTAYFLEHLRVHCPAAMRNVYAISAVSGGAFGALIYTANQRFMAENPNVPWHIGLSSESCRLSLIDRVGLSEAESTPLIDAFFQTEIIPSIIGAGLFSDVFQRLVPPRLFPSIDRSDAFRRAFSRSWQRAIAGVGRRKTGAGGDASNKTCGASRFLECPSHTYWTPDGPIPLLVFNATSATNGSPVVLSNIDRTLLLGVDKIRPPLTQLPLISGRPDSPNFRFSLIEGASASAGFPIALPATVFEDRYGVRHMLVDGGYFDNSGLATAITIKQHIERRLANTSRKVSIIYLHATEGDKDACDQFRKSETNENGDPTNVVIGRDRELAHADALFNARNARSEYTLQLINERVKSGVGLLQFNFELHERPLLANGTLQNNCDLYAPLAFYFSQATFNSYKQVIQSQMLVDASEGNGASFAAVERLVKGTAEN